MESKKKRATTEGDGEWGLVGQPEMKRRKVEGEKKRRREEEAREGHPCQLRLQADFTAAAAAGENPSVDVNVGIEDCTRIVFPSNKLEGELFGFSCPLAREPYMNRCFSVAASGLDSLGGCQSFAREIVPACFPMESELRAYMEAEIGRFLRGVAGEAAGTRSHARVLVTASIEALVWYDEAAAFAERMGAAMGGLWQDESDVVADDPEKCAVCLEGVGTAWSERARLGCGHELHCLCIAPWLLSNTTCPLCRCALLLPSRQPIPCTFQAL